MILNEILRSGSFQRDEQVRVLRDVSSLLRQLTNKGVPTSHLRKEFFRLAQADQYGEDVTDQLIKLRSEIETSLA